MGRARSDKRPGKFDAPPELVAELAALTDAELLERAEAHLAAGVNRAILEDVLDGVYRTMSNRARYRRGRTVS